MKIIIFGSTGGTGSELIKQALEQGHEVTAFARNPEKIIQTHEKLSVIEGDVLNNLSVEKAVQGHDAVLCSLGMSNIMDKSRLRARGTKHIVQAMEKMNMKKLICQSSLGTGDSYNLLPFHYKYLIAPLFMKKLYEDHSAQEKHIKNSQLEWIIVRPAVLSNGEHTGNYKYGLTSKNIKIKAKISRADTADFMLKQLTDNAFLYKAPYISY